MNRKIRNKFFLPPPPSTDTEALVDIESKDYDLESITSSLPPFTINHQRISSKIFLI